MSNIYFRFTVLLLAMVVCYTVPGLSGNQHEGTRSSLAKEFVDLLSTEAFESAVLYFDSNVRNLVNSKKLSNIWLELTGKVGPFRAIKNIKEVKRDAYYLIFVTCRFQSSDLDIKLTFNKKNEIAGMYFVPTGSGSEYKTPPYVRIAKIRDVAVEIGSDPWRLPGTLTLPRGKKSHPAVILVHGSGPNDRDETIGPNKPFRDIAEGLASKGIAVLRYEKRTKQYQANMAKIKDQITVNEETVVDALAAVKLLRNREEIDLSRIFLLGHSLGGMMIPRIGLQDSICAGFILMAAPTRSLEDAIIDQVSYIFNLDSVLSREESEEIQKIKRQVNRVKNSDLNTDIPADSLPLGINARYWHDLKDYNPALEAGKLGRPLLILHAERDYQVNNTDLRGWRESLAYENDVEIIVFPGLNHLFIKGKGSSRPEEYMVAGNVAPEVIQAIANWIEDSEF